VVFTAPKKRGDGRILERRNWLKHEKSRTHHKKHSLFHLRIIRKTDPPSFPKKKKKATNQGTSLSLEKVEQD